ncbi:MAG: diguanylate cyclase [Spirochaetia bacterium]|nr:diguanylate cyclase [Spirochaetia bacterium]
METVKILIVEDENIVAKDIQHRLMKLGYREPIIASNGDEALRKALQIRPDIVLMDIMLSRGTMDGVDVAMELRRKADIPLIYLTAYADAHSLARAKVTEPYGYILKPFQTRELHITIEMAVNKHRIERQLKESKQLLSTTLSSIGDAVITTDSSGKVTFLNRVAERLTGWFGDEAKGMHIGDLFLVADEETRERRVDPISALLSEEPVQARDMVLFSRDSSEKPVETTASRIVFETGESPGAVLVFRDITERKMAEEWVRYLAYHDVLTGLPNRSLLFQKVGMAMAQTRRHSRRMAFLFIDLDDFKIVNDTHGHSVGDSMLRKIADRIIATVREDDIVVRSSGDEFIVVLNDVAETADIELVANKILTAIRERFTVDAIHLNQTVSIGISTYPTDGVNVDDLIRAADTAMYAAKRKGKNTYALYGAEAQSVRVGDP